MQALFNLKNFFCSSVKRIFSILPEKQKVFETLRTEPDLGLKGYFGLMSASSIYGGYMTYKYSMLYPYIKCSYRSLIGNMILFAVFVPIVPIFIYDEIRESRRRNAVIQSWKKE